MAMLLDTEFDYYNVAPSTSIMFPMSKNWAKIYDVIIFSLQ